VADSDYLNRSIMVVCGPGGVRERIESATEARRTCDIANIAHAAGKRAVEGDLVVALRDLVGATKNEMVVRGLPLEWRPDTAMGRAEAALASAGQEVKT
jgi:hypothetical protein